MNDTAKIAAPSIQKQKMIKQSLSVIIVVVFAYALTSGGMLRSYDSEHYIDAALTFRETGTIRTDYASWTPLYPMVLSLSADPLTLARWLNIACYALTAWLTLGLVNAHERMELAIVAALMLSPAISLVQRVVWSEPLFISLLMGFFVLVPSARRRWFLLAIIVALACVQRFTGILLIPLGVLALRLDRAQWYKIFAFVVVASVPIGLWMLRNVELGYPALGARSDPHFSLYKSSQLGALTLAGWVLTFVIALIISRRTYLKLPKNVSLMFGVYSAIHFSMTVYSSFTTGIDGPDDRLLAPIFIPVLVLILYGLSHPSRFGKAL